jgi:UrcA family protein
MIPAGIAVLSLGAAGNGSLAYPAEPLHMTVSYADLDLQAAAGAEVLYRRLQSAAQRVCHPLDNGQPMRNFQFQRCYKTALDSAVAQVNKPILTAMHSSKRPLARG